jgi:hypothetical protein
VAPKCKFINKVGENDLTSSRTNFEKEIISVFGRGKSKWPTTAIKILSAESSNSKLVTTGWNVAS